MRPSASDQPSVVSYFVASFIPEPSARRLGRLAARLPPGVEPHSPDHLHLTWRSFDGLPHGTLAPLKEALCQVGRRRPPLTVELLGGGAFAAGAIWARACPSPALLALQADIDAALGALGLPEASYPFVPHVTLGVGPAGTRAPGFLHDLSTRFVLDTFALTTSGTQPYRMVRHFGLEG